MASGFLGGIAADLAAKMLPNVGKAFPEIAATARVIAERLVPDPKQAAEVQAVIEQAMTARVTSEVDAIKAQNEQQLAINLAEAQGNDRFSSRWRPAAAWVCVAGLAYQYIFAPVVTWAGSIAGTILGFAFPVPPTLVMSDLWPILAGLLGLGFQRTYERTTGVPGALPPKLPAPQSQNVR